MNRLGMRNQHSDCYRDLKTIAHWKILFGRLIAVYAAAAAVGGLAYLFWVWWTIHPTLAATCSLLILITTTQLFLGKRHKDVRKQDIAPPKMAELLLSLAINPERRAALLGDLDETFQNDCRTYGLAKARQIYWASVLRSIAPLVHRSFVKVILIVLRLAEGFERLR
jgi:hypothetical protein